MSQAPRGKKDWMRDHYEKVILMVALVALLFSSVWLVKNIQDSKAETALSLGRVGWKGSVVGLKDTANYEVELVKALAAATNAMAVSPRTLISELRVSCVKCGKPIVYDALECPFCRLEQPAITALKDLDTDGDGLPDEWELAVGLDPQNSDDASKDLDGDGFTNVEEYSAKTDAKDDASLPDPIVKLRVAGIRPVPFYLRFVSTSTFGDGTLRYQLNLQTLERTYFTKLGDVVLGYKVESHDPVGKQGETLTMVRQSDKRPVVLVKGRPVTEQELAILFVSLLDRKPLPIQRLNDVFEFRGVQYKVVDIRRESVVIQSAKTGEKITVPQMSGEERAGAAGKPAASAPSDAGTNAPW